MVLLRCRCKAVVGTHTIGGLEYTFEETGRLTSGVWVHNANGSMYSYGPAYYYEGWKIIDGKGDPNFDLWLTHADVFMQDLYRKAK